MAKSALLTSIRLLFLSIGAEFSRKMTKTRTARKEEGSKIPASSSGTKSGGITQA